MVDRLVYDLLSPAALRNPHPIYAQLREEAPVYYTYDPEMKVPVWLLTRYDDSIEFLKDPRFSKDMSKQMPPGNDGNYMLNDAAAAINKHMLMADPPDHTRLRALVSKAFTPRVIENLRPRIQEIADNLLNAVEAKGQMDLIAEYALPLPITVIAELLGIPAADRDRFRHWSQTIVLGGLRGDNLDAVGAAALEFIMYFHEMFDRRRAEPQDDLLTGLVMAEEAGDKLDQQELLSMVFLLLVAGHETTVNLIGNGTLALLEHPDQLAKLKADPSLMKTAIEEMLRYNGPVGMSTPRWARETLTIRGQTIHRGEQVAAVLLAANRDPQEFDNPDIFDITRAPNRHIAFGHGIHYCLGAPLARLEGSIALDTLLRRLPNLRLAVLPEQIEWTESLLLHGMKALPVVF
ncbi:MAG: cytochrome P450 [Chloroflexi bacterium]|nr:cytochrome P450 [Chloroflexota bacterium]